MADRFVRAIPKTVDTLLLGERYPKLILSPEGDLVITDVSEESFLSGLDGSTPAIEPSDDLPVTLGVDFDTCIFLSYANKNTIVKRKIPAPELTDGGLSGGSPILSWTNAFDIPTLIYRTDIYLTGAPATEFTLIAQIPGTSTPGGTVEYTDSSITLADENDSVSYLVKNRNGSSNIIEFTGEIIAELTVVSTNPLAGGNINFDFFGGTQSTPIVVTFSENISAVNTNLITLDTNTTPADLSGADFDVVGNTLTIDNASSIPGATDEFTLTIPPGAIEGDPSGALLNSDFVVVFVGVGTSPF
jgi:hypothetical protein